MNLYIFIRVDLFYPLELKDDHEAKRNAEINHGTIRVEEALSGKVIWREKNVTH
jgi:hypothetical protein